LLGYGSLAGTQLRLDHVTSDVESAYSARATEYADVLGSMAAVHPSDRQLVTTWAEGITGPVIDAGCGPGHWTHFLADSGVDVEGVDLVPEFIQHARGRFPGVRFRTGTLNALNVPTGALGGILSWYSLIHQPPESVKVPLAEFARVIKPGGSLLLGFFEGPTVEAFAHAVVTAYRWPVAELSSELRTAGFDTIETHTRTGPGYRPHGAILARRTDS
jgi:SAM-dependent methyltransferase